jgi:hypothetical protein
MSAVFNCMRVMYSHVHATRTEGALTKFDIAALKCPPVAASALGWACAMTPTSAAHAFRADVRLRLLLLLLLLLTLLLLSPLAFLRTRRSSPICGADAMRARSESRAAAMACVSESSRRRSRPCNGLETN